MKSSFRLTLRACLILLVVGMSMMVTAIMSVVFYGRIRKNVQDNYRTVVAENLHTRADMFDAVVKEAYLICTYGVTDDCLPAAMHAAKYGEKTSEELLELLRSYIQGNDTIHSVYCYVSDKDLWFKVSQDDTQIQFGDYLNHAWLSRVEAEEKTNPFSPVYNRDSTSVIQRNFFSFAKAIFDGEEKLGTLIVNMDERQIFFDCLQSAGSSGGTLSITQDSRIVSTERVQQIGKKVAETGDTLLVTYPCDGSEYSLCSLARTSVIDENLKNTRNWILLVALLLNILLTGPIYLLLRYLLHPMKKLEESMNTVKEGDLTVRATVYRDDEIGSLSENFNDMLEQLETLIDELVTQKMLKKEAELEALSYQITPHFMYNTLSSIRYAAILDGYQEIGDLLQAFTELLRLSASDRGAFITVQQEMKMVSNYIRLQQFRYKDTFRAEFSIEPGTELFYVPRLLIQPLVENAILHGLDHAEQGNLIRIMVRKQVFCLEISVTDNGSGMTQEEIDALLSGVKRSKFSGIGIHNIIERLRLYYGDRGSLNYYCPEEGGTTAVIRLPISDDAEEYVI